MLLSEHCSRAESVESKASGRTLGVLQSRLSPYEGHEADAQVRGNPDESRQENRARENLVDIAVHCERDQGYWLDNGGHGHGFRSPMMDMVTQGDWSRMNNLDEVRVVRDYVRHCADVG